MEFMCTAECDGPQGQHWFEGDTYTLTRRDLLALKAADLLGNFEAADEEGESVFAEVEAMENK